MKTGFSLWELAHREFPVSYTGFGFTVKFTVIVIVIINIMIFLKKIQKNCIRVKGLLEWIFPRTKKLYYSKGWCNFVENLDKLT